MPDDVDTTPQAYTIRLELVDRPGELLRALEPIADLGANLLSIFHERGNITPRGRIPVEIDLECPPDQFDQVVAALRDGGINVIQAGADRYGEELVILLIGHLIEADLSDTIRQIENCSTTRVIDFSLTSLNGPESASSARVRLAVESGSAGETIASVRTVARDKNIHVIEPIEVEVDK